VWVENVMGTFNFALIDAVQQAKFSGNKMATTAGHTHDTAGSQNLLHTRRRAFKKEGLARRPCQHTERQCVVRWVKGGCDTVVGIIGGRCLGSRDHHNILGCMMMDLSQCTLRHCGLLYPLQDTSRVEGKTPTQPTSYGGLC
jgi:hypothetical protein